MLAFVVGAILGIGEQKLSGTVATRAGELFSDKQAGAGRVYLGRVRQ